MYNVNYRLFTEPVFYTCFILFVLVAAVLQSIFHSYITTVSPLSHSIPEYTLYPPPELIPVTNTCTCIIQVTCRNLIKGPS